MHSTVHCKCVGLALTACVCLGYPWIMMCGVTVSLARARSAKD